MKNISIVKLISDLWRNLGKKRQTQTLFIFGLMFLSSLAEIISIGAVIPFLALLISPESIEANAIFSKIFTALDITNPNDIRFSITVLFSLVAVISMAIRVGLLWFNIKFAHSVGSEISCEVYSRSLYQPYIIHVSRNSSEIISAITNKVGATVNVIGQTLTLMTAVMLILMIMLVFTITNPLIALATVTFVGGAYAMVVVFTRNRLSSNGRSISAEQVKVIKALQEGLGGIRDVILDQNQKLYCDFYRRSDRRLRNSQGSSDFIGMCPRYVMEAVGIIFISFLAYNLNEQAGGISESIPILGALALGAQRLLPAFQQAFGAWSTIKSLQPQVEATIDLLQQKAVPDLTLMRISPVEFNHSLRLSDICFRYTKTDKWAIESICISIPKGKRVAIVGRTGSGKSTLIDIIMGLLEPTDGSIFVDDRKITNLDLTQWQRSIAHVPQSIYLIDGTIAENIALGIPSELIDLDRVLEVAIRAQLTTFIDLRADGFNTVVGERGVRLSGGQRQRIGIARALYKRAPLLIFDEATSALDNTTERSIINSIESLDHSITVILIAHRLTSVKRCDLIIELDQGKVVAQGTFDELIGASESFKRMAQMEGVR